MNKSILYIVGLLVVAGIGIAVFRGQQTTPTDTMMEASGADGMMEPTGETMKKDSMMEKNGAMMQQESRYVAYSKAAFDEAKGKKRVYFFYAPWCPTCRPTDAAFQKDPESIPQDVVLFKTDYDSSVDLKKQYNVTYQHTFVQVDDEAREVTKWNGGGLTELRANTK